MSFYLLFVFQYLYADVRLQILQTGDIHSHFISDTTPLNLGGLSRLKTKIDNLRSKNENTLLLDAGDWTEGSIFFVHNSGEANHRVMESMGYDAIVFGNHDWLAGPEETFQGFEDAQMKVPVLSANLNTENLNSSIPLERYIFPYMIQYIGGKKVGVFGLSTFQIVFDPFLEPAEIEPPLAAAKKYADFLKNEENCDVVIALTHIGIAYDKMVAYAAPNIDLIVGGHSHILLQDPYYVNGVPIVHVGKWGWYLGQYELLIKDSGEVELVTHRIHQIDESIRENSIIKSMIDGFKSLISSNLGPLWGDKKVYSDIDLPIADGQYEYQIANWSVDAIRKATNADIAIDHMNYRSQPMYRGWLSTVDFFNLYPHNWSTQKNRAWNIYEFEIRGNLLKFLMNLLFIPGPGITVSNAEITLDHSSTLNTLDSLKIGGREIRNRSYYKVAGTEGVLEGINFIQSMGWNLHLRNVRDTGVEAWRYIQSEIEKKHPIQRHHINWEGRIRTKQGDVGIISESINLNRFSQNSYFISLELVNIGLSNILVDSADLKLDLTPKNTLDNVWYQETKILNKNLAPGERFLLTFSLQDLELDESVYPVQIQVHSQGDSNLKNNIANAFVYTAESTWALINPSHFLKDLNGVGNKKGLDAKLPSPLRLDSILN